MAFWRRPLGWGGVGWGPGAEQSLSFLNWEMQEIKVLRSRGCCAAMGCAPAHSPQKEGAVILPGEG